MLLDCEVEMRGTLVFGWLRAGVAAMAACVLAEGGSETARGCAMEREGSAKAALWREAWRCAASVSSPIDAGRTKIALVEKAIQTGDAGYVRALVEADGEAWVKGAGLALLAADAALGQRDASPCMQGAQACAAQVNEWREPFLRAELRKGEGALVATSKPDVGAGLAMLREWVDGVPAERTTAAAWVCAEWVARRGARAEDGASKAMVIAALDYGARTYPWDRLAVLARLAPQMKAHGMTEEAAAMLRQMFSAGGDGGAAALSTNQFETALLAARAWNGLGRQREASPLIVSAEGKMRNRDTGDALAPGMALAEAKTAMGIDGEAAKLEWLEGLRHAVDRPGFYRSIAAALTVGGIAASPCAWTQEDVARVGALADGAVAGQR